MTARPALTNALLATFVVTAFVSGWIAFAAGTEWGRIVVVLHGVAGLGLVVLAVPKIPIVRRGWQRDRPGRIVEIILTALALVAVISGIAQATGRVPGVGPFTMMQVHVTSGVVLTLLTVWHSRRRPAPRPFEPARRAALQSLAVAAGAGAVWVLAEGAIRLSGTERRFTGSHERGSFDPRALPVTSWINDRAPTTAAPITIDGVEVEVADLDQVSQPIVATLDCTTGWYSTQEWHGVPLSSLIDAAQTIEVRSATGYRRRFPASDAPHLYLATRLGGEPLTRGHGAPVRLVAPGRRGFWWVKWVATVTTDSRPWWLQFPFPLT